MAGLTLTAANVKHFFAGQYELGGQINSVNATKSAEALEDTTLDKTAKTFVPGQNEWIAEFGHIVEGSEETLLGTSTHTPMFIPLGLSAAGDPVLVGEALVASYSKGAGVGSLWAGNLNCQGSGGLAKGLTLYNALSTPETAAGNGTEQQLGTVSATQYLLCTVCLKAFTGTSITFTVESDATGFASPTTRITFAAMTAAGAKHSAVIGPITPDDYFRLAWTGTITSATFIAGAGII